MAVLGHRFTAADVGVRQPAKWVDSIGGGMQRGTLPLMTISISLGLPGFAGSRTAAKPPLLRGFHCFA